MLRTSFAATILDGALAGTTMAQAPDAGCALLSEPEGIPAAIDAAITGPADKDRACMKALLIIRSPHDVRFTRRGPSYTLLSLEDWITRTKARGHAILQRK